MKPYPAYKGSGVEWLGEVPEGWEVRNLKHLCHVFPSNVDKHSHPDEIPVQLCNYTDVYYNDRITASLNFMDATATDAEIAKFSLRVGDVIFTKDSEAADDIGIAALVSEEVPGVICGYHLSIARPNDGVDGRFIKAFFDSAAAKGYFAVSANGLTRVGLGQSAINNLQLTLPPLPEQQAIAAFLDRETAKIDGLIEEQRRLIALLAEKRQATISHAVTRGLNPSARLKPSGVDCLGDIPEGWEVVPLKRKSPEITVGIVVEPSKYYVESGVPALRSLNVRPGRISSDNMVYISDNANELMSKSMLRHGDVVAVRTGQPGTCAVVPQEFDGANCIDLIIVRRSAQLDSEYLVWFLTSDPALRQFSEGSGGAIQLHFNVSAAKEILVSFPPLDEQREIAAYLSRITAQLDTLTETATSAITLLQERRAALISAAVTGKIDIREIVKVPVQASQSLHVSAMVAGVIIARHGQHFGFGRMMVQKFLFMTQACANAPEIGGDYERQAAGPLDRDLQNRVETDLEAAGLVRVRQEGGPRSRVQYEFLGDATALCAELASALGDRMERFDYLSNQLGSLTKNGIEAVATLYAAWNDFLIDGRTPDRADIIREVLENWHPEKSRKFTADELVTWLDWMERQNIVPDGTGPQTQTGRLFP
ncbi:restriction endonuclease subunit S [Paracoccus sp. PS-1]|uniref:restriction endonuclease subunit S n=1 Tax=Paracoccus sp. PS1 TaxID=2963938 RepID=UPI0027E4FB76|nr:restriction endonuclease subunit S [Paracoccus sp. PS1]MDQ7263898.1 restriction endonuclease subunit S [Paracoccus sp. PS1]